MTAAIGTDMVSYFIALSQMSSIARTPPSEGKRSTVGLTKYMRKDANFSGLAGSLLKVLKACGSCMAATFVGFG